MSAPAKVGKSTGTGETKRSSAPRGRGNLLTAAGAAKLLGLSIWSVYDAARLNRANPAEGLPHRRIGRSVWFSKIELQLWLSGADRLPTRMARGVDPD